MSDYTHIAWTDLETTGLDPERDSLLEVGIVLTDRALHVIAEESWIIKPATLDMLSIHPIVREMHTANRLFDEVIALPLTEYASDDDGGRFMWTGYEGRDQLIFEWLNAKLPREAEPGCVALGGSGVSHFDVRWIKKYLLLFDRWLYRSTIDVGVMRRFIENVAERPELVPEQHRDLTHRALDDARDHLAEARVYKALLGTLNTGNDGPMKVRHAD